MRGKPMEVDEILDISIQWQMLCGFARQGIIHRDIKPAIYLCAERQTKILDFGLANRRASRDRARRRWKTR